MEFYNLSACSFDVKIGILQSFCMKLSCGIHNLSAYSLEVVMWNLQSFCMKLSCGIYNLSACSLDVKVLHNHVNMHIVVCHFSSFLHDYK